MSRSFRSKHAELSQRKDALPTDSREQLVEGLRDQLGQWASTKTEEANVFSCGVPAIDQLLPAGGLRHGMLVEWMMAPVAAGGSPAASVETRTQKLRPKSEPPVATSSGTFTLALLGAREACREGGVLVVIDRTRTFYPPAAAAWGIDLKRMIVVWPQNARDEIWAAVQSLRSPVVAAMWASIDRLDSRAFRRLQLAAEAGRTLGILVRPARARAQPSWADVRLEIESRAKSQESRAKGLALDSRLSTLGLLRCMEVRLVHCRQGRAGGKTMIEIDDVNRTVQGASSNYDTHSLSVVSQLADPASRSHSARA